MNNHPPGPCSQNYANELDLVNGAPVLLDDVEHELIVLSVGAAARAVPRPVLLRSAALLFRPGSLAQLR
jgi:hypothetical protein